MSIRSEHLTIGNFAQAAQPRSNSPGSSTSPVEPTSGGSTVRSPFGMSANSLNPAAKMSATTRSGAGSPSHDMTAPGSGRFLPTKRAREIQAQEGFTMPPLSDRWGGPPTSGNSTPLRENIPESPTGGFPDFVQLATPPESLPSTRRARAGTVPSRFSPGGAANGMLNLPNLPSKTSRPSPSHTPFKSSSPGLETPDLASPNSSTLLSRLRAGSMPQRPYAPQHHISSGASSPFGVGIFNSWNPSGRERGSTLASIASVGSTNGPSSPTQSQFSQGGTGENDVHMRTLDYLGLAETPQPPRATLAVPYIPNLSDMTKHASRFRSFSVNHKDKYAEEEDDYDPETLSMEYAQLQDQLAITNAAIHQHTLAIRHFQNQAMRPRARTAGVLDSPGTNMLRQYYPQPSRLDNSMTAAEMQLSDEKQLSVEDIVPAVAAMSFGRSSSRNNGLLNPEEQEGPTSALWLGSIPTSTTTSTLEQMFKSFGQISSARVLTHKNCGFVNFERVESAINAKASMNGKEIFPGAGPIRINFAKPPSTATTPGADGAFPSPSPDPFARGQEGAQTPATAGLGASTESPFAAAQAANMTPTVRPLQDMSAEIIDIVQQFGATDQDVNRISGNLQQAIQFQDFVDEIPPIQEPAHTRVHDAPKLRDIRKRIDNGNMTTPEIENIAMEMLPEIAELASDYLGNTVVQKLFEHCGDEMRDAMLREIAPHLAKIGVHKNGTWAAQKIIEVCNTPTQMELIVQHLRPYAVPLFLDQFGNYVVQCTLKFGAPWNDFIFETMLSRMWEIAQGRYGARAMRACLESHHSTKDQQRLLAAAIALHSVQLATNANGALLLTWFLDTCTFPQRRTVLSPQLVPYLLPLCTHKVAYLTVLKVLNQKHEIEARDNTLKSLFMQNDQLLEAILSDSTCGAQLIFKIITGPYYDDAIRPSVTEKIKSILIRIKAQPGQGYKRLMDEVGLSTRNGGGSSRDHSAHERQRPASRAASVQHQQSQQRDQQQQAQQQAAAQQYNAAAVNSNQFYNPLNAPGINPANFDAGFGVPRGDSDPLLPPQYPGFGPQGHMYNGANGVMPPMNMQQMQYQQSLLQRATPPMYNSIPAMQAGFTGYSSPSPAFDQYRGQVNGSPIQPPGMQANQGPFAAPPGYPMGGMGMGGNFGYGGMNGGMQNMAYMQEGGSGNNRRGGRQGRNQQRNTASPRPY